MQKVRKFTRFYDSEFGGEIADREAEFIHDKLRGDGKILSVGCGIGSIEKRLQDLDLVCLDVSLPMLKEARRRWGGSLVLGIAEQMPFKESVFDEAFFVTTMEFLEDYRSAIREAVRVLKPTGGILVMMLNPNSDYYRSRVKEKDSYFKKMQFDPSMIEAYLAYYFSIESQYFLGIEDEEIFDTQNPELASLYIVQGILKD